MDINTFLFTTLSAIIAGILSSLIFNIIQKRNRGNIISIENKTIIRYEHNNTINQISNNTVNARKTSNNNNFTILVFALLCFVYFKYNLIFNLTLLGLAVFLITFLISIVIFNLKGGIRFDKKWTFFWVTSLFFSIYIPYIIYLSFYPLKETTSIQGIIDNISFHNIDSVIEFTYGLIGLIYTVVGFLAIIYAIYISISSLFHLSAKISSTSKPSGSINKWILSKTKKYSNPVRNANKLILYSFISFLFVSGLGYHFLMSLFLNFIIN